ncbi:MAG: hypothetical protein F6J86_19145 [Symploca sp. SIO1B1]|nr:hypothetical protein [Symploca sp. SIO1B1]
MTFPSPFPNKTRFLHHTFQGLLLASRSVGRVWGDREMGELRELRELRKPRKRNTIF